MARLLLCIADSISIIYVTSILHRHYCSTDGPFCENFCWSGSGGELGKIGSGGVLIITQSDCIMGIERQNGEIVKTKNFKSL